MYYVVLVVLRFVYFEDYILWNCDLFNIYFLDIVIVNGVLNFFVYYFIDLKFKWEVKSMF